MEETAANEERAHRPGWLVSAHVGSTAKKGKNRRAKMNSKIFFVIPDKPFVNFDKIRFVFCQI